MKREYFDIGYSKMGPMLLGFEKWLENIVVEDEIEILLFASREGLFFQKGYQGKVENQYFYVSRKSLQRALLWKYSSIEDILETLSKRRIHCYLITVIDYLGLNSSDEIDIIDEENASINKLINWNEEKNPEYLAIQKIYKKNRDRINNDSKRRYKNYKDYISQLNLSNKRVGFVDIGWRGNMQQSLDELLRVIGCNCNLFGYYMLLQNSTPLSENVAKAFIKDSKGIIQDKFSAFGGLIEILCSANHGSVRDLVEQGDSILPVFEYWENDIYSEEIISFQEGALAYTKDKWNSFEKDGDLVNYYNKIVKLGISPSMKELAMFSKFRMDTKNKCVGKIDITWSVRQNLKEFALCGWKVGALRNIFIFPMPYFSIYRMLKRIANNR